MATVRFIGLLTPILLGLSSVYGREESLRLPQTPTVAQPVMAEQVFRNVQVLKGISVREFLETMGFFAASTPFSCGTCHGYTTGGDWAGYAQDTPMKKRARKMIRMTNALNQTYFKGTRGITCYSCHRNTDVNGPKVIPSLADQYGSPLSEDPEEIAEQAPGAPSPDEIFARYIRAVGGSEKLDSFTSIVAQGTYQGYDDTKAVPMELSVRASGQISQLVRGYSGNSTWVDNGHSAWIAQSERDAPAPVLTLAGGDLDGSHLEAKLYFPALIKELLANVKVGFPISGIGKDDRELMVMQGKTASGNDVKLYFDEVSGLLVRMVRYTKLPVGWAPTEVDFADYREISGIKLPFQVTKIWVNGRSVTEFKSIELDAPIPDSKFEVPIPALQLHRHAVK
jgi:photosynthetic reaction center cytochrome c subunit